MAAPLTKETLTSFANLCSVITKSPILSNELYVRYDKEADVLYIMFDKDSKVYLSRDGDNDVLWEYDVNGRLVGVTIMDASMRTNMEVTKAATKDTKFAHESRPERSEGTDADTAKRD